MLQTIVVQERIHKQLTRLKHTRQVQIKPRFKTQISIENDINPRLSVRGLTLEVRILTSEVDPCTEKVQFIYIGQSHFR